MEFLEECKKERFMRPSKCSALKNPYSYKQFCDKKEKPLIKNSEDVIYAFFGILEEASNLMGFTGGCGTVGEAGNPYPYAYDLFSCEKKEKLSFEKFVKQFSGIAHITFLKLYCISQSKEKACYMIEAEVIKGKSIDYSCMKKEEHISFFMYYYGTITVKYEKNEWKIQDIHVSLEDFLCAPYHGWSHDAKSIVEIVYRDNMKVIEKITDMDIKCDKIYICAEGCKECYRFEFIRLTNGCDILINEWVKVNGRWISKCILNEKWKHLKLE